MSAKPRSLLYQLYPAMIGFNPPPPPPCFPLAMQCSSTARPLQSHDSDEEFLVDAHGACPPARFHPFPLHRVLWMTSTPQEFIVAGAREVYISSPGWQFCLRVETTRRKELCCRRFSTLDRLAREGGGYSRDSLPFGAVKPSLLSLCALCMWHAWNVARGLYVHTYTIGRNRTASVLQGYPRQEA